MDAMIYLDNSATSFRKPPGVYRGVLDALRCCANPGRGGYGPAMAAQRRLYGCREAAAELFDCRPEQVVLTTGCTHGLNMAIATLVKPGSRVVISGFEHNAVTRTLHALGAKITVAGRKLFDPADTLAGFSRALDRGQDAAVFTHVSNVFGYRLPVEELARLCRRHGVPFVVDAAQSAGMLPLSLKGLGADFIAMPGHKGLLGPQGTGLLLCAGEAEPLLYGGTGSHSLEQQMPRDLPDRLEPGTLNVPGFAGLREGLRYLLRTGVGAIGERERVLAQQCVSGLRALGMQVFSGADQTGVVSFRTGMDCQEAAAVLGRQGIALRAGLHCAPLAHESAGTLETGTLRLSTGWDTREAEIAAFLRAASKLPRFCP